MIGVVRTTVHWSSLGNDGGAISGLVYQQLPGIKSLPLTSPSISYTDKKQPGNHVLDNKHLTKKAFASLTLIFTAVKGAR